MVDGLNFYLSTLPASLSCLMRSLNPRTKSRLGWSGVTPITRTREGAATEAIRLLVDFGFATLGLVRIEIVVAVGNFSSQRAAEKAGAYREGLLRNRITHRGEVRDAYMFSLVPSV